jgi:hypothetical protein
MTRRKLFHFQKQLTEEALKAEIEARLAGRGWLLFPFHWSATTISTNPRIITNHGTYEVQGPSAQIARNHP